MVRAGRENSETITWQEYRNELYHFVLKRVQDKESAEDIVHDVLVKVYTRRQMLREPSKLRSWLYQITRNAIIDHYRSRKTLLDMPGNLVGTGTGELAVRAQEELALCLEPLLDSLPDLYRKALKMAELDGVTQREVASQLGLSLSGAKSRVQRGRRMLLEAVLKCCRVELDRRGGVISYEARRACGCSPGTGEE